MTPTTRDTDQLRQYVTERVRSEVETRVEKQIPISEADRRAITEEVMRLGGEEIDYTIRRLVRDARRRRMRSARHSERKLAKEKSVLRFSLFFRIQHLVLAGSVLVLIITGAPIKFHQSWLGDFVRSLQLVDTLKVAHRVAAAALALVSIVHVFWVVFTPYGWRNFVALLPTVKDFKDFVQVMKVLLGRSKEKPRFGRFNFIEKFDYWAVYWGVVIMVGTGTLLAFNTYFMNRLGQYSMHIAKLIHSDEALLASLALLLWHFYWSHFNPAKFPMNKTFLTGTMTVEEMIEEHPMELEERVRGGEIPLPVLDGHPEWQALHPAWETKRTAARRKEGAST